MPMTADSAMAGGGPPGGMEASMGVGQPLAQTSGMPGVPFHKAKKHGSKKRSHRGRKRGK